MPKRTVPFLVLAAVVLAHGCSDPVKVQDKLKGLWILESRTPSGGVAMVPPEISGRIEWFEMDAGNGHMSYMITSGLEHTQFLGAHYHFQGTTAFDRDVYARIGGGTHVGYVPGTQVPGPPDAGTIEVDGARQTLRHADGTTFEFQGASDVTLEGLVVTNAYRGISANDSMAPGLTILNRRRVCSSTA